MPHVCVTLRLSRLDAVEFQREQDIRPRSIDKIREPNLIPGERFRIFRGNDRARPQFAGKGVVLAEGRIHFELRRRLEFELRPATHRVQAANPGRGIRERAGE